MGMMTSSHGEVHFENHDGTVTDIVANDPNDEDAQHILSIVRVDVDEFRRTYKRADEENYMEQDILDFGYWCKQGDGEVYSPPEWDWRCNMLARDDYPEGYKMFTKEGLFQLQQEFIEVARILGPEAEGSPMQVAAQTAKEKEKQRGYLIKDKTSTLEALKAACSYADVRITCILNEEDDDWPLDEIEAFGPAMKMDQELIGNAHSKMFPHWIRVQHKPYTLPLVLVPEHIVDHYINHPHEDLNGGDLVEEIGYAVERAQSQK